MSEEQFQEVDLEITPAHYDENDPESLKIFFETQPLTCCKAELETDRKVSVLYGGRGVKVERHATCPKCNKEQHHEVRFRDGYAMTPVGPGKWAMLLYQEPVAKQWLRTLFTFGQK